MGNANDSQEVLGRLKQIGIEFRLKKLHATGFHGTSRSSAERIMAGQKFDLELANEKSWLGRAIYFYDNVPLNGYEAAFCFACHFRGGYEGPTVLSAELKFKLLLDLCDAHNGTLFWAVLAFLRDTAAQNGWSVDVDEKFVAHFIGTKVADEMKSDGVGWRFPIQEPRESEVEAKWQHGFAAKKVEVVEMIRFEPIRIGTS